LTQRFKCWRAGIDAVAGAGNAGITRIDTIAALPARCNQEPFAKANRKNAVNLMRHRLFVANHHLQRRQITTSAFSLTL